MSVLTLPQDQARGLGANYPSGYPLVSVAVARAYPGSSLAGRSVAGRGSLGCGQGQGLSIHSPRPPGSTTGRMTRDRPGPQCSVWSAGRSSPSVTVFRSVKNCGFRGGSRHVQEGLRGPGDLRFLPNRVGVEGQHFATLERRKVGHAHLGKPAGSVRIGRVVTERARPLDRVTGHDPSVRSHPEAGHDGTGHRPCGLRPAAWSRARLAVSWGGIRASRNRSG